MYIITCILYLFVEAAFSNVSFCHFGVWMELNKCPSYNVTMHQCADYLMCSKALSFQQCEMPASVFVVLTVATWLSSPPLWLYYLSFSLLRQSDTRTMAESNDEELLISESITVEINLNDRDPKQITEGVDKVQIICWRFCL